ncbi:hypothetical protein FACS1894181_14200 [Bacteroidia bacterium]|nr:hypothetical protein FACS1894181_14200 [Bacteroidia bacterium]
MADGSEEGGFSAELVRNNSFDLGESLPGWKVVAPHTYMSRNANRPLSADNPYSLMVSAYMSEPGQRGGVAAEGYGGISVKRGEKYFLSFYMRTSTSTTPAPVQAALEDSAAGRQLSRPLEVLPSYEWTKYTHTFVAEEDAPDALLTFSLHKASYFWLDRVSLVPEKTWNAHGLRPDVMEKIDSLAPSFILYKGKAEEETLAMYRQMSQDLDAELILTIDSMRSLERSYYADENYLIASQGSPVQAAGNRDIWVNGLASTGQDTRSTFRAAVAEACFLIHAESNPRLFSRIAFAPVMGSYENPAPYPPLVFSGNRHVFASPSYYLLKMFARNRGDVILPSHVQTYSKPQTEEAAPAFDSPGNSFELERLEANRHGAASLYNYEINAVAKQVKEKGRARLQINRSVHMTLGAGGSVLYRQAGALRDTLSVSQALDFKEGESYAIRIVCRYDSLDCFLDGKLIHRAKLPPLPSISAIATLDKNTRTILLKVVNTTLHNEITEIKVKGASIHSRATVLQMKGDPASQNTPASPWQAVPIEDTHTFPLGRASTYKFPPNSITIMQLTIND